MPKSRLASTKLNQEMEKNPTRHDKPSDAYMRQ